MFQIIYFLQTNRNCSVQVKNLKWNQINIKKKSLLLSFVVYHHQQYIFVPANKMKTAEISSN